ncbi:killer cell lectin-like receptor subfamily B member 1F isoform X1 [Anser cygnoides]|uniref:killer cell lectin-like receptor subfamily B member 1F isoform X1 n=2 Tax=Anser cygnoides TaxID=8845 RepID=UPI00200947DD|nr:killer cell lectin-like receptor subfamily F member 2 isoform X1 [Anser cygnoides]
MSENLIYADLNLTESRRSRLQKDINVQDSTYAELNVQSLDTSAVASYASFDLGMIYRITYICSTVPSGQTDITNFKDSRRGKNCCSRTHIGILIAVIILLLVLGVGLTFLYHPTTSSPQDRETLSMTYDKAQDCPQHWKRNGKKCYFFSQTAERKNWKAFHDECTGMHSELVTIDNKKELDYLISQSTNHYYLLGLQYNESKKNWEWINGREHSTDMFNITGPITGPPDYFCTVVGFGEVSTAPCYESSTTKNMCEKGASISEKAEEERQKTDSSRNLTPSFV